MEERLSGTLYIMSDWSDVEYNERADFIFHDYSMSILSELNQKK